MVKLLLFVMEKNDSIHFSVQNVEIDECNAAQRIDNFLIGRLKGVPKSRIYRMLRKGEVRVNKGRTRAEYRLNNGDIVRIPPVRMDVIEKVSVSDGILRQRLGGRILFEDQHLIVFNKPSGTAVHGGSGLKFGVIEGLRQMRPDDRFLELVHRLDRDTSGCLLIAKKRSALRRLHELFRQDQVSKRYLALLIGQLPSDTLQVDEPLLKNVLKSGERMVAVSKNGKPASTRFFAKRKFSGATLVEARPKTGRTHQIRVHAAHIGCAIAGDDRYGLDNVNRQLRQSGLKRLFLHASSLRFQHPATGKTMTFEAPLASHLVKILDSLDA